MKKEKQIAFIILNYLSYENTMNLIESLKKQYWYNKIQIYVVENGSYNESLNELTKFNSNNNCFAIITSDKNLGLSKGFNLGIKEALKNGYKFIICSNNDILINPQKDFLDKIFEIYNKDNNIAIIAPSIKNLNGIYQNPFRIERFTKFEIFKMKVFYLTYFYKLYYYFRIYIIYDLITYLAKRRRNRNYEKNKLLNSRYIYAPHGSFLIFTPAFFKYFNGFDPNVFLYCEEFILAEMLRKYNLKCWFENSMEVLHLETQSLDKLTNNYKEKVKFTLKHTFRSFNYFIKNYV